MAAVLRQHSLQDLVDNFTPGGCYAIEWECKEGMLKFKDHFNPQWRIDGVKAKGLDSLYTKRSQNFEFQAGEGLVGRAFAKQEVLFVKDLQEVDAESMKDSIQHGDTTPFKRADLAKEFDLHSAMFLPSQNGVLEVGSAAFLTSLPRFFASYAGPTTPPVAWPGSACLAGKAAVDMLPPPATPPPFLQKLVEEISCAGCYGIEWVLDTTTPINRLVYRSAFNPQWRLEGIRQQGLKGTYTTKSIGVGFPAGEGVVGRTFAEQKLLFIKDVQAITPEEIMASLETGSNVAFLRSETAKEFGIRSVLFLPSATGVWEVGSIQVADSLEAFLKDGKAAQAISEKQGAAEILKSLQALTI